MGPIQSSLNQLTLSAIGAVAGLARGFKGPKAENTKDTKPEAPKSETGEVITKPENMGTAAKLKGVSPKGNRKFKAEEVAALSGNALIFEKARLGSFSVSSRIEEVGGAK